MNAPDLHRKTSAILEVRCNATGEVRSMREDWYEENGDFIWADGNYACDCNRSLFFDWCIGIDTDSEEEGRPCGDSAFSVRLTRPDGMLLYSDGDW